MSDVTEIKKEERQVTNNRNVIDEFRVYVLLFCRLFMQVSSDLLNKMLYAIIKNTMSSHHVLTWCYINMT